MLILQFAFPHVVLFHSCLPVTILRHFLLIPIPPTWHIIRTREPKVKHLATACFVPVGKILSFNFSTKPRKMAVGLAIAPIIRRGAIDFNSPIQAKLFPKWSMSIRVDYWIGQLIWEIPLVRGLYEIGRPATCVYGRTHQASAHWLGFTYITLFSILRLVPLVSRGRSKPSINCDRFFTIRYFLLGVWNFPRLTSLPCCRWISEAIQ